MNITSFHISRWGTAALIVAALIQPSAQTAHGQTVGRYPNNRDNVPRSEVTVSRGPNPRRPADFDYYYYLGRNNGFALSPYVFSVPQPAPRVAGPTIPYSPAEYSKIVQDQMNVPSVAPSGAREITRSIVQETTAPGEAGPYRLAETKVINVTDRGVIITDTREEVRLRGISIPTERSTDDITRYYAREANRTLSDLTVGQTVFIAFDEPLRGRDGTLLGTVYLRDGTNLNRLMLEMGYGTFVAEHFLPDQDASDYVDAQELARTTRAGLWSK